MFEGNPTLPQFLRWRDHDEGWPRKNHAWRAGPSRRADPLILLALILPPTIFLIAPRNQCSS
jgi:hypothetical protein